MSHVKGCESNFVGRTEIYGPKIVSSEKSSGEQGRCRRRCSAIICVAVSLGRAFGYSPTRVRMFIIVLAGT